MRDCDVMVERINCRNMNGAGGQKTGDKINIPMGLARRRDIESKLCNNLICSGDSQCYSFIIIIIVVVVAVATRLKGVPISPNISTGSLSKGASPGPYVLTTSRTMGSTTLDASQSHPESSDIPVLKAV